jgi:hypothetical protein
MDVELPGDGDDGRAAEARRRDAEVEQLHVRNVKERLLKVRPGFR